MKIQIGLLILAVALIKAQDPYCLTTSSSGGCSQCIPFFYLKNGACTQVSNSCLTYDNSTGSCTSCFPGSTLSLGTCVSSTGSSSTTTYNYSSSSNGVSGGSGGQSNSGFVTGLPAGAQLLPTTQFSTGVVAPSQGSTGSGFSSSSYSTNSSSINQNGLTSAGTLQQPSLITGLFGSNLQSTTGANSGVPAQSIFGTVQPTGSSFSTQSSQFGQTNPTLTVIPQVLPSFQQSSIVTTPVVTANRTVTTTQTTVYQNGSTIPPLTVPILTSFNQNSLTNNQLNQAQTTGYQQQVNYQQVQPQQQPFTDPNCVQFLPGSTSCQRCATRYYINNQTGLCVAISGQCSSYDQYSGACTGCYPGFVFMNNECYIQISATASSDPYCKIPFGNTCQTCYQGYYVNNGVCTASNPLCANIDSYGNCVSCYSGYLLSQGNCVIAGVATVPANCANFTNGVCVRCSQGSYFNNGNCFSVSSLCRTYDNNTGVCTSCYNGYMLSGQTCVVAPPSSVSSNCKNFSNGYCVECSQGYLQIGGACKMVDPLCQTSDRNTGLCSSCYSGYSLNGFGQCVVAPGSTVVNNCRNFTNGICYECSKRFYKSGNQCLPVNDYCNDYDMFTGACTSCYQGFILQQGACYRTIVTQNTGAGSTLYSQAQQVSQLNSVAQQQAQQSQQSQATAQNQLNQQAQQAQQTQINVQNQLSQQAAQQAQQNAAQQAASQQQAQQQFQSSSNLQQGTGLLSGSSLFGTQNAGQNSGQGLNQGQAGYYSQTTTTVTTNNQNAAQAAAQAAALASQQGNQQRGSYLFSQSSNNSAVTLPSLTTSLSPSVLPNLSGTGSSGSSNSSNSFSSFSSSSSSGTGSNSGSSLPVNCLQSNFSGGCLICNPGYRTVNGLCVLIVN